MNIEALKSGLPQLSASDRMFAQSLLDQMATKGSLSPKQAYWVDELTARATKPAPAAVTLGDFGGVIALFAKAQGHLKYPKIRLRADDGQDVCLSVAGPNSKAPGTVNVTDGRPFGENKWFGRVTPAGEWQPTRSADAAMTAIAALLGKLANDPAGTAAAYGKLTGNCCFCNTALTDERSTRVGYGKTCAKHYGLAWG